MDSTYDSIYELKPAFHSKIHLSIQDRVTTIVGTILVLVRLYLLF